MRYTVVHCAAIAAVVGTLLGCGNSATESQIQTAPTTPTAVIDGEESPPAAAYSAAELEASKTAALATMRLWGTGATMEQMPWRAALDATLTPSGRERTATMQAHKLPTGEPSDPRLLVQADTHMTWAVEVGGARWEVTTEPLNGQWLTSAINPVGTF